MDNHPIDQPENTYRFALNLVNRDLDQESLSSNEYANELCYDYGEELVGYANIDELDGFIIFLKSGEIHFLNPKTCKSKFIASDTEFGCDWGFDQCEFIYGETKALNDCNELYLYWSSGCEYYWVNYSELANEERKEGLKTHIAEGQSQVDRCGIRSCDYFKVFDKVCSPRINATSYEEGGSLPASAIYVTARLKDSEGGITNFFNFTNPVYIGSENNQSGERSTGLVEIDFSNLDCDFNSMDIGIVMVSNGIKTAKLIPDVYYVNDDYSYTYTGTEGIDIELSTLMVNGKTYLQGKDMVAKDGVMWYYNIRQRKNPDLQRSIIDSVEVLAKGYRVPYSQVKKYDLKSMMGGENYALAVIYNSADHVHTRAFHIPGPSCDSSQGLLSPGTGSTGGTSSSIQPEPLSGRVGSDEEVFVRERNFIQDSVSNPQLENLDSQIDTIINGCNTELNDLVDVINNCHCAEEATQLSNDEEEINLLVATLQDLLTSLGVDHNLAGSFTSTTIKEGAQALSAMVNNRQRTHRKEFREFLLRQQPQYHSTPLSSLQLRPSKTTSSTLFSASYHDENNEPIYDIDIEEIYSAPTEGFCEQDILYPLTHNCEGELIYGELAGTPVRHHKMPDRDVIPLQDAYGGVPSVNDTAGSEDEAFVNLIGLEIRNIPLPTEEELGFELCKRNPYTIGYVKRTDTNKSVIMKGIATKTYVSQHNGVEYIYPRHGVNSNETVDRYISYPEDEYPRLERNPEPATDINFWSLDALVKKPALNINTAKVLYEVNGQGQRYGLYTEGVKPDDSFYGHRLDNLGTRQAVNLHNIKDVGTPEYDINYKIYAPANSTVAPPRNGNRALMNKYRQESVWLGLNDFLPNFDSPGVGTLNLGGLNNTPYDLSFVGDGWNHDAVITRAASHYMTLKRNKPNQYGSLVNMSYIPLFQSGPQHYNESGFSSIESIAGDTYVGATSFVRTGYVSDKVGSCEESKKYNTPGAPRCICDPPDDPIMSANGLWVWPELPENGDRNDPKNWCNLRSDPDSGPIGRTIARNAAANGLAPTQDHYYPRTLKTLVIYWGEFEVCPWRRTISDDVTQQVFPEIKPMYGLDTSVDAITNWKHGLLQQFYARLEQASQWQKLKKALIRTTMLTIAPILGVETIINVETGIDIVSGLIEAPFLAAMWKILNEQLYPNNIVDKLVGIPMCPSDNSVKRSDEFIQGFFHNYNKYNADFSAVNDIKRYFGLPDPYYTCDCDDCDDQGNVVNEYYFSDKQIPESNIDAWKRVRPRNSGRIPANRGQISKMFEQGGSFFAHTTDGLYQLQYTQTALPSDSGSLIMGRGDILADPMPFMAEADEGVFGLNKWTYSINSQYGYFSVDINARKVYQMIGGTPKNITPGVNNFFKEFLEFCNQLDCHGELSQEGTGLALGVDPRNDRFLITKQDGKSSWTLSYDIKEQHWVSFHSYIPQFYIWDRDHMFTVKDGAIWKHDSKDKYQNFYGEGYPHIIEFTESDKDLWSHQFESVIMQTFAHKRDGLIINPKRELKTFDEILVYNTYQTTGPLKLNPTKNALREDDMLKLQENVFERDVINEYGQWRVNGFYDMTTDPNKPVMINSIPCTPFTSPINFGHNKISEGHYENRIMEDVYNMVRLSYYDENTKLYTRAFLTKKSNNSQ